MLFIRSFLCGAVAVGAALAQPGAFNFNAAQSVMKKYCLGCHIGKSPAGGFDVNKLATHQSLNEQPRAWSRMIARVRDGEMPPKNAPQIPAPQRERFVTWADTTLRTAACADGISPGPAPMRRLNRNEYGATMRDLLNIHVNAAHVLPADGAGGEGFDNAAETLFLSPIHAEKYLDAAKQGLEYGAKDPRSRARFLVEPTDTVTTEQAATQTIEAFIPRAFRRPAAAGETAKYIALYRTALQRGDSHDQAILFALQGILVSPHFLFRIEEPNTGTAPKLVDHYAMATRLSYFLWGSMPDAVLFDLAAKGKLNEPAVLSEQVARMLKDVKAREFAEQFVEQWLNTRELGRDIKPDPKVAKEFYDAEIGSGMRYEPILFFQELLANDLSLLELLDSKWTVASNRLAKFYGFPPIQGLRQQPKRIDLPEGSRRGGLLGMAAIHALTSYPQRTSPVLRGKWLLDAILGTPPPPPPPNVPELKEEHAGVPSTVRERLMQHRANPVCASCHDKIDPLGFALENYDVLGRWRTEESGKPVDARGELADGTKFEGPEELKKVLLAKKDLFLRNLTTKMLGYALGRGLTLEDYCTVDNVVKELEKKNYSAQTLIREIVLSVPFRYRAGTVPNMPAVEKQIAPAIPVNRDDRRD